HARFELCLILPAHTRGLMYFQTESVSGGVHEISIEAIAAQNSARCPATTATQHSRFNAFITRKRISKTGPLHPPAFSVQLAYGKSSSHVAGVTSHARTHIN